MSPFARPLGRVTDRGDGNPAAARELAAGGPGETAAVFNVELNRSTARKGPHDRKQNDGTDECHYYAVQVDAANAGVTERIESVAANQCTNDADNDVADDATRPLAANYVLCKSAGD